jgi:hypothetical protein
MKQISNLETSKLHPYLQDELQVAIKITQTVATKYFQMTSEKFDSINEFALHLQDNLYEPLSTISCVLYEVEMPDEINLKEVVQTSVYNYLEAYIKSEFIGIKPEPQKERDDIVISGLTLKVWICEYGSIHVSFKGSPLLLRYLTAKAGATYEPISEEERIYRISFIDGGIS